MSVIIHPTALIEEGAQLGQNVKVGPFCTVSAESIVGDGTELISHVVLRGRVELGKNNSLYPFVCIGAEPQDISYKGEDTRVKIGDQNVIRESVTIHRGTPHDRGLTQVGSKNYIMAYCHIAHDCVIEDSVIMANQVGLAGHVTVEDHAVVGGMSGVGQRCRIGAYSFVGGFTGIRRDLPPFMAAKEFSVVTGPNLVGLRRHGMTPEDTRVVSEIYKIFYLGNLVLEEAIKAIESRYSEHPCALRFIKFVRSSKMGVQR